MFFIPLPPIVADAERVSFIRRAAAVEASSSTSRLRIGPFRIGRRPAGSPHRGSGAMMYCTGLHAGDDVLARSAGHLSREQSRPACPASEEAEFSTSG